MAEEKISKSALKKLAKQKAKEERRAKALAEQAKMQEAAAAAAKKQVDLLDILKEDVNFGDVFPVHDSRNTEDAWVNRHLILDLNEINESVSGQDIWLRGRVHNIRTSGKSAFVELRQRLGKVQCVAFVAEDSSVTKDMIRYINALTRESVVEIFGTVSPVDTPISSCDVKDFEIQIKKIICQCRATNTLPLQVEDAMRTEAEAEEGLATVSQLVRLDNRYIDLRTPANQAIMRVKAGIAGLFREYMTNQGFCEIFTPKIQGGASEGGSAVFGLDYFGSQAFLAQSPQLYKQMSIVSDLRGVFEVGPVFRAENSNTHRHLCEFTGLDFEMEIKNHYHEVLKVLHSLIKFIVDGIYERFPREIENINKQYPFERCVVAEEPVILNFKEGCQMLRDAGYDQADLDDLTTENEKALGRMVKDKYGVDFFILDRFPMAIRPFYTMPHPEDNDFSCSYDLFIRGQEITSGAQRIHDYDLLIEKAEEKGVPPETLGKYVESFMYGAAPHGGAGIGLERLVMLVLGLDDARKVSMFPRDPKRLAP